MRWRIGIVLLILAAVTAVVAWARSPLSFRGTGGPAPPPAAQTISSITQFTAGSTFTANTPNAVVGSVIATMNPAAPPFGGSLSITGANSCGFHLSGGTQVQAGSAGCSVSGGPHGNGLYDDWNVVATQTGVPNSPLTQAEAATATTTAPPPLLPSPRDASANWKVAGLQSLGGIPSRTNVCATVNPSGGDDTGNINTAITNCGTCPTYSSTNACVVSLGSGTFLLSGSQPIVLNKSVVLRGQGAGVTVIDRTNGAVPGNFNGGLITNARLGGGYSGASAPILLTSNVAKGDTTIHVASTTGISVGSLVNVDELGLGQPMADCCFNTNGQVWAAPDYRYEWNAHNPAVSGGFDSACYDNSNFTNGGNCAAGGNHSDATGYSIRGGGVMEEEHLVSAVNAGASTITFDSPLTISFRTANSAAVEVFAPSDIVRFAGIENLTMSRGGDGGMQFQGCVYCWASSIENYHYYNPGVHFVQGAFRDELVHSWLHNGAWPVNGGGGYSIGLTFGSSEILIDDNISMKANKVIVMRASGAGSVVSYNYMDDGYISQNAGWVETGPANSHLIGAHHALFEGNVAFNTDSDFTHGASSYATYFRNWFTGIRAPFTGEYDGIARNDSASCCSPLRALAAHPYSYRMSAIANILGTAGVTTAANGWVYSDNGGSGGNSGSSSMLKLGWNDYNSGTTPSNKDDVMNTIYPTDPTTLGTTGTYATATGCMSDPTNPCTTIVADNYDYVTGTIHNPVTIPNSLYLTGPPAWWGSGTWPPFNPVGPVISDNPAHQRFLSCSPVSDNSSSAACLFGIPASSIPCDIGPNYVGSIPAGAQAAGFTHCAANYDFTNTVAYNSANMSTWLSCPDSGSSGFQLYCVRPGSSVYPPASDYVLINDGGVQALQQTFTPTDAANGVGGTVLASYSAMGNPNPTGFFIPAGNYIEYVGRTPATSVVGNTAVLIGAVFLDDPHTENWVEVDPSEFYTYNSGGPPTGSINNSSGAGEHCVGNFNCGPSFPMSHVGLSPPNYDPTVYNTYGARTTLDTAGNMGICTYYSLGVVAGASQIFTDKNGNPPCNQQTLNGGASDSAITARLGVKFYDTPQGQAITKALVQIFQRVTVWTCPSYQTTSCATGVNVSAP